MSKFLLSEPEPAHHAKCQDECGKREGPMLKCMNLAAIGTKPCPNVIHVVCAGYDLSVVPHMTGFYCTDCTTANSELHHRMEQIEQEAKNAAAQASSLRSVPIEQHEELKSLATKMQQQLSDKIHLLKNTAAENDRLMKVVNSQEVELKRHEAELKRLNDIVSRLAAGAPTSSSALAAGNSRFASTFIDQLNETIRQAEKISVGTIPPQINVNYTQPNNSSSIAASSFDASHSQQGWPDYNEQYRLASEQDEHTLLLVRASLAKPIPFDGDVTKWAVFLSEFVRTSSRGHYRDFEDMDRLRELIIGEARDMFVTELSDPCAEALPTLMRLDEFFGVKGNAVRVALDRLTQLPRIDKANDRLKLKGLYTCAKQFALQCRVHKQEMELTSESTFYIMESKMHNDHVKAWRPWIKLNNKSESLDGIIAYLEDVIRDLNFRSCKSKPAVSASVNATSDVTGGHEDGGTNALAPQSTSTSSSSTKSQDKSRKKGKKKKNRYANCECFQCREKHPFYVCPQLIAANATQRLEIVNRLHVCQRCLCSNKHVVEDCHNRCLKCYISGCNVKNKHPILHGHTNEQLPKFTSTNAQIDVHVLHGSSHFAMVPGDIIASDGTRIPTTIMYDSGSGISLTTLNLYNQAKYESHGQYELTLRWATDVTHTDEHAQLFDTYFLPQGRNKPVPLRNLTAVQDLRLPEQEQDPAKLKQMFPYLSNVPLPSYARQSPQILLGLSHAELMTSLSTVSSGKEGDPVAALTPLGWIVYGNCSDSLRCRATKSMILGYVKDESTKMEPTNEDLIKYIRYCNDVDSLGIAHKEASLLSAEDQQAEEIIKSTMKFHADLRRYEIGFLWISQSVHMPDNYEQAVSRLISTEKRLEKLNMLKFVQDQFEEQIRDGWLIETTKEEADGFPRRNYVYGFLTFNKNKNPPKPRWVNDTAATYKGVSLNTMLLKGPDNMVPLPQSMCALREGRIAYQGDVKAMFNQVMLKYEDQFSQLTLWRNGDATLPPRIYRQTRIIFGPRDSPSKTSAIRMEHAKISANEFPEAADVAMHQMYVDDAPDSRDTVEEAAKVANDLIKMFSRIGWPLVQFQSNSNELLQLLPKGHISEKMVEVGSDEEELITKVLGIFWKPQPDVYVYRLNDDSIIKKCTQDNYLPTKREMLSTVMRIFDPTGQISPFRIRGHMIMQHVWRAGTDWKKRPPKEICDEFTKWLHDFVQVSKLQIPRAYSQLPLKDCELSLHVFVDAGSEAYAACVYIQIIHGDSIQVRLIAAKARVAPLKYMSIPRLELMSGLIGARLLKSVVQWHRRLHFVDYTCWTDSEVSYKWIRSPHLPKTAFTAPRIAEIQELTSADKWRYVPSKLNVADFATKERQMDYSDDKHEWFMGPKFLYEPKDKWPEQPKVKQNTEATIAVTKVTDESNVKSTTVLPQVSSSIRSNWPIFTRVVAKALRFADHLIPVRPQHRRKGFITPFEWERAENYIIRLVQKAAYPEDYKTMTKKNAAHVSSDILSLSPFMCPYTNLIRASTRFSSQFPYNMRYPPILPNFHEVTDAIVTYFHDSNFHVGDSTIVSEIRSRVWIINAKRAVRRGRARCIYCIQQRKKIVTPNMADLPDFRLDINQKPFYHTGCDLFGPFTVYTGRSKHKHDIHIVIFTCMVTRAVYLEVLDDKSTDTFLAAFEKLWARRGPISHMYSDNGLNFVGAARVIDVDEIQRATAEKRITWHFNPAYTPQFGGAWERLIKDIKRGLSVSIGKFTVPRLTMETALAKIEANLNNRPLTELPVSSMDEMPLTPQLLMTGYPNYPAMNDTSDQELCQPENIMNIRPARRVNALVQAFRHRFIAEYAPIITRKPANKAMAKYMLKMHDFVIYCDPTKNPSEWQRGVICKVYPGRDHAIRVADVKLKNGLILERRPAHLLAKLDIRLEDPEAESSKYTTRCQLLVNQNLNRPNVDLLSLVAQFDKNNLKTSKMSRHIHCAIFDDSTKVSPPKVDRSNNCTLSEAQKSKYIDESGNSVLFVKNLPPQIGASEIYTIMSEHGQINLIASSKWNGTSPINCFIGYSDPASVSRAMVFDESQIVTVDNMAYRLQFERVIKIFRPLSFVKHAICTMLQMTLPNDIPRDVLFITNGITNRTGTRTSMPAIAYSSGFINFCPSTHKYEFETKAVDISNGARAVRQLPFTRKQEHIGSRTHMHRSISLSHQGHIRVQLSEDPFEGPNDLRRARTTDLRELLNSKRDANKVKSVIIRPKKIAKRLG